jgi:subtilase family serine protease
MMIPLLEPLESRQLLSGMTPVQIERYYGLEHVYSKHDLASTGAGVTIAVVVAFDASDVASELTAFDRRNHLPAVDLAIDDRGTGGVTDPTWGAEALADLELIHTMAPGASLLLVQAADTGYDQLMAADQYAAEQSGVVAVENGWGGPEFVGETFYDQYLQTPGVVNVAAVGDTGTLDYPAASPDVIAVGGFLQIGTYRAPMAQVNHGQSAVYAGRTTPDVTMSANTSAENGTSASSAEFAGLVGLGQAARIEHGLAPLGTAQLRTLMDSAAGDRAVFTPVRGEAGVGLPKGPAFIRLLSA